MHKTQLGELVSLGFPIFLLIIASLSLVWFVVEIKRKRIDMKTMIIWLIMNIIYIIAVIYILLVAILNVAEIGAPNIFNMFAYSVFGINMEDGKQWIILLILAFISYVLVNTLVNTIKISKLNGRVDDLSKEVAIISGKINKTSDLDTKEFVIPRTYKEIKIDSKERVKIAKLEVATTARIKEIHETGEIKPPKKTKQKTLKLPKNK